MKHRLSHFFLLAFCLLLCACGESSAPPELGSVSQWFDTSALSQEALEACLQAVEAERTEGNRTVHICQTMGDHTALHVFGTITSNDGTSLTNADIPSDAILLRDGSDTQLPYSTNEFRCTVTDDGALSFAASFGFDKEVLTGEPVCLDIADLPLVPWTPENTGLVRYVDLTDETGKMVGTCNISGFALNITLWNPDNLFGEALLDTVAVLDKNGDYIPLGTCTSKVGNASVHLTFGTPIATETIGAVQVGSYTTALS